MHRRNSPLVCVSGNIASGKTTLCENISKRLGYKLLAEDVSDNPFLELFYQDMTKWAYPLQAYFLARRFAMHKIGERHGGVVDRTLWEDRIFADNLYNEGIFPEHYYGKYTSDYDEFDSLVEKPDLIIYLQTSVPVLWERLKIRNRGCEINMKIEYLADLNNYYEEMFGPNGIITDIHTINTNGLSVEEVYAKATAAIEKVKNGKNNL